MRQLRAQITGIGMKTHPRELVTVRRRPVLLILGETLFLAGLVLFYLRATS